MARPQSRAPLTVRAYVNDLNETTFASYRRVLRSRNRSEQTISCYEKAFRELDAHLNGADIAEASKADIQGFMEKRLSEVSGTTVAIRFRSLRAFFRWAVDEEIISSSPMEGMTEPQSKAKPVEVLLDDDLRALLKTCTGKSIYARRDEAIVRILCEPGSPRLGEIGSLRLLDVDRKREVITVSGKTGTRSFPFGHKTGTAIDRYLRLRAKHAWAASPALWVGPKGALSESGIAQMLNRRSRAAGLGRINPHRLRHTTASNFLEQGGNEGDAVALFGWKDATMIHKVYGRSAAVRRAHKAARRMSVADRL
jgi:site-specific recombinase XerD